MAQNKKRLLIIPNTLETFGGGERWTLEVATELKSILDVSILNPIAKTSIVRLTKNQINREYNLSKIKIEDMTCTGINSVAFGTEPFILMFPTMQGVFKMRESIQNADVVYQLSFNPIILFYSILFSKIYNKKFILGIHNPTFAKLFDTDIGTVQKMLNYIYRTLIANVRYFHVINKVDEKLIKNNYKNAMIYNIPNFVKPVDKNFIVNKKDFIVLFVGRLEKNQKGIDLFYKSMKKIMKNNKDIIFHIVGSVGNGEYLIKKIVKNYPKQVKELGFLKDEDLRNEYRNASLFVLPSRFESFGLSLLEAQSYGLPAVAFDVDVVDEILKNKYQGTLVEPFDDVKFADEIMRYFSLWKSNRIDLSLKRRIAKEIRIRYDEHIIMKQLARMLNGKSE